ncbi:NAD(P)H-quinone oxidoreductase [Sphingomonas sp. AR_OL41]|uniref:NAD(P)H-quinone oxidoreductase n=1 Tax=Sphingomonas sp. AR_OL41 TaxID=3042729 RepID=UPI0024802D92|nr:NAD(P)H-quinone oxidoreductase [Sphingomonas sp. AR_OL41]MDH7972115.1 NAD(P)H-quinone oxidoreductase [Sphingomonas sp. AR_OL41]
MRAITFDEFGGPDVLRISEVADPVIRPADLLVRVRAAGVNRADLNQRRGAYGREYFGDSGIMGLEVAGEVIALGTQVTGFSIGDRVMGIVGGGGYAEIARIPAAMAVRIPSQLDFAQAAAIPEAFITMDEALVHLGRLRAGETVLIHGAAGGVGLAGVRITKSLGGRVLFTARDCTIPRVVELGGDVGFDYRDDFLPSVIEATDGEGVDLIVDTQGHPNFERNVMALREGGRLIQLGLMGGRGKAPLFLDRLLFRRLSIIGSVMKSRSAEEKAMMTRRFADRWLGDFAAGAILPIVAEIFALDAAAVAHARMEAGGHVGKLVLIPQ